MRFRLGAMSVGDILDRSIKLLSARFGTFVLIGLMVQAPLVAIQLLKPTHFDLGMAAFLIAGLLLFLILTFVSMAAQLKVIEQEYIDNKIGVGEAIGFAFSRIGPLILVSLLLGLIVGVGLLLCVIPGLIFYSMYAFALQAVVIEGYGASGALERSARLTRGYRGRVFLILFLTSLLNAGISFAVTAALTVMLPPDQVVAGRNNIQQIQPNQTNQLIINCVSALIQIVVGTYSTICLTLTYFDLRARKEGFDLELAARGLPQEERQRRPRYKDDYGDDPDDDEDDRPRRSRRYEDGLADESRGRRDEDDDDRPRRARRRDEADEDRPRPGRRDEDGDGDDDRPRQRRRDDDDDGRRRR